jgi:hypothetical protein
MDSELTQDYFSQHYLELPFRWIEKVEEDWNFDSEQIHLC